jgi:alkanesulfonate monooxygenase SsuD/methylene tetrahydromethanopterin reductase-like flavin-dependent oxidoreductase (luciferase family)
MQLRIFTEPQQGASYDQLLAVARAAEVNGFDAFFRSDHLMRMGDHDPRPGPTESWVTLGALARQPSRTRSARWSPRPPSGTPACWPSPWPRSTR